MKLHVLRGIAAGLLLALPCRVTLRAAEAPARPNILVICTDDQRADALSVVQREQGDRGRFPWLRTPHMDRLAADGVRFRNAFVVSSLCSPSRAVFLTGRYNHLNGVASNFRALPPASVTYATLLREAGYTTGYVGKWHMGRQRERPGFDFCASYIAHGRYEDAVFVVNGTDTDTRGWVDDVATDYAIEFLRARQDTPGPWALLVGYKTPHAPSVPPARAESRFAGCRARRVPNLASPVPYLAAAGQREASAGTGPDDDVEVGLGYFRCLSAVDDCLGRLLDALDESGMTRDTIVVSTSDNGFYLGEHGLVDKRSAYEESMRIPLIVRYPALGAAARGRVVDAMVLNLDLAQTLLDFAAVPAAPEMQGRSWRPLLEGRAEPWRGAWLYEYFAESQPGALVPDVTAVRTVDAKLIRYVGHPEWTEVFDLAADPYETRNLFADPAHAALRTRLEAEHDRLLESVDYRVPDYTDRPVWWGKPATPEANPSRP